MELEHIDGNSENNDLSNLTLLCPNCHSLTSTYKGRNIGNGRTLKKEKRIYNLHLAFTQDQTGKSTLRKWYVVNYIMKANIFWWSYMDLNHEPFAYQANALTN